MASDQRDILRAKRACWLIFCIDKEHAMRRKTFSVGTQRNSDASRLLS
jgi:hypothetical protein